MTANTAKSGQLSRKKAIVLAKATRRAAEHLGIKGPTLSEIIGVSTASIHDPKHNRKDC